ncbi:hypothetical protein D3C81_1701530 [compost metagenome]
MCQFGVEDFAATEHQLDRPAVIGERVVDQGAEQARYATQHADVMTDHQIEQSGAVLHGPDIRQYDGATAQQRPEQRPDTGVEAERMVMQHVVL